MVELEEPVVLYIKFSSNKDWLNSFALGNWYLNSAEFFKKLEEQSGKRGQGDKNELQYNISFGKITAFDPKTKKEIFTSKFSNGKVFNKFDKKLPIFCITGIKASSLIKIREENGKNIYKLPFSDDELLFIKKNFGNYCAVVQSNAFHKRLNDFSQRYPVLFSDIKYVDEFNKDKALAFLNFTNDRFFFKDIDLSYQREFRLCIFSKMTDNHIFKTEPFTTDECCIGEVDMLKKTELIIINE